MTAIDASATRRVIRLAVARRCRGYRVRGAVLLCLLFGVTAPAAAETSGDSKFDAAMAASRLDPHLDAQAPLDLALVDMEGNERPLGTVLNGKRPAILALVYYTCPSLCQHVMNGLVDGLRTIEWRPGTEFDVIVVSIDPRDAAEQSKSRHAHFLELYGRPETAAGWHHMTGTAESVRRLAETIGFGYVWSDEQKEYMHGAGIFLLTPTGKLSRFLGGVRYESDQVEMALVEAGEGKIGSRFARFVFMTCMSWDPVTGRYIPAAFTILKIGGALTILIVGGLLLFLHASRPKAKHAEAELSAGSTT